MGEVLFHRIKFKGWSIDFIHLDARKILVSQGALWTAGRDGKRLLNPRRTVTEHLLLLRCCLLSRGGQRFTNNKDSPTVCPSSLRPLPLPLQLNP